jgi:hypothetical protein
MTSYPLFDPTSLFAGGDDFAHRNITVKSGSTVNSTTPLPRGTVLGRITATDKYIPSVATASDGSQVPACILADDSTDPSLGDVVAPAYFQGEFADGKLTFDSGWTSATLEAAFRQAGSQIYIRTIYPLG